MLNPENEICNAEKIWTKNLNKKFKSFEQFWRASERGESGVKFEYIFRLFQFTEWDSSTGRAGSVIFHHVDTLPALILIRSFSSLHNSR